MQPSSKAVRTVRNAGLGRRPTAQGRLQEGGRGSLFRPGCGAQSGESRRTGRLLSRCMLRTPLSSAALIRTAITLLSRPLGDRLLLCNSTVEGSFNRPVFLLSERKDLMRSVCLTRQCNGTGPSGPEAETVPGGRQGLETRKGRWFPQKGKQHRTWIDRTPCSRHRS